MMSIGLTGCANTDVFSGDVYSADQAKEARSISYGTIVSVRPVKIQADNNGVNWLSWWWVLWGYRW